MLKQENGDYEFQAMDEIAWPRGTLGSGVSGEPSLINRVVRTDIDQEQNLLAIGFLFFREDDSVTVINRAGVQPRQLPAEVMCPQTRII